MDQIYHPLLELPIYPKLSIIKFLGGLTITQTIIQI